MLPIPLLIYSKLEPAFIEVIPQAPIIIGTFGLTVNKTLQTLDNVIGTQFNVTVTVTNTGNVAMGNFTINNIYSYDGLGFSVVSGYLAQNVGLLEPNASVSFSYILQIINEGYFNFTCAQVKYYFVNLQMVYSQSYQFKAREPGWELFMRLYLPMTIGVAAIFLTYRSKIQYNKEDLDLERRETLMFGQSLRESAWHRKNITEFLEEEKEAEQTQSQP